MKTDGGREHLNLRTFFNWVRPGAIKANEHPLMELI